MIIPIVLALTTPAFAHEGRPAVNGVVEKVDQAAGKVTLKHDAIPNLDMDAMTMAWPVKNPAMLQRLKAGDKVKFEAEQIDGQPKIVEIEKAK
jgi:Cu/Ag efflux protein CusF